MDRPHSDNAEYPITPCDCLIYFDFVIKNYSKKPKAVRIVNLFEADKYWDEKTPIEIVDDVEEEIID